MSQMYFVNGRYVSAEESRKLRGLDGKEEVKPEEEEISTKPEEPKKEKKSKK